MNQYVMSSLYCVTQEQFVHLMSKLITSKNKPDKLILNRLAAVLKEERVSNKSLARILGYEPATISKWTTNTIQPPLSTFLRIALSINRDLKDFFVPTQAWDEELKNRVLQNLADMARNSKRTGKYKK